jgi:hypothetical protein
MVKFISGYSFIRTETFDLYVKKQKMEKFLLLSYRHVFHFNLLNSFSLVALVIWKQIFSPLPLCNNKVLKEEFSVKSSATFFKST